MGFKFSTFPMFFLIIIQLISADTYPKNEFNSNDSTIPVLNAQPDMKKDLKKESLIKEVQNENLKILIKDGIVKENFKNILKDNLPQRDNSKATFQKEEKSKNANNIIREQSSQSTTLPTFKKDTIIKNQTNTPVTDETHLDLADLFIGTITGTNGKMSDFRNPNNSTYSKPSNSSTINTSALDDLRIKVIEQVHMKAKIFFQVFSQALSGNQLLRESLKNKNDGLANKINSIYSSTPYLRPFQAPTRPPANTNSWCASLSNSFAQYAQLNAFLLAAFLLFPVTIPFYLLGWLVLFATRSIFCIGAKQIFTNIIYRIRSS